VGKQAVVLVNLVDVETRELVGAWSVHVTLALPAITKTYELRLPAGRAAQKKISYSNPWDQPQTILLRSSAPRLLLPREPVLQLPGNGQAFLRLAFAARTHSAATPEDIYLFINDKRTDQNEECLLFQVAYE
jgi:nephrocystin-4